MASLRSSAFLLSSDAVSSSSSSSSKRIRASFQVPNLSKLRAALPMKTAPTSKVFEELKIRNDIAKWMQLERNGTDSDANKHKAIVQLCAILEAVSDRIESHRNIGEQRDNWNSLLFNSINMITLSAATMAGLAAANSAAVPLLAFKLSSTILFSAATGMLIVMNKIQPSQLVEEQRNAVKLFRQLQDQIQILLNYGTPASEDVQITMEKVLALDKAYPLPLLGAMLEKFPSAFEPAVWWPQNDERREKEDGLSEKGRPPSSNGWSEELEVEMREIVEVMKRKDLEDYVRLGNIALKVNKILAVSGPLLAGIAAISAALMGNGSWAAVVAMTAGALAAAVNSLEHGGQVGMVFEMYRNCGGFFRLMEDSIETALRERDEEKRENGEVFEMKVALQLGRSLSQLRELAKNSSSTGDPIEEFASKLF